MLFQRPIRLVAAYLLLLLFSSQFLGRALHHVLAHHHHEDVLTCEAAPGDTHLHDERYSHSEGCALCLLPHAAADALPELEWVLQSARPAFAPLVCAEHIPFVADAISLPALRGPPART